MPQTPIRRKCSAPRNTASDRTKLQATYLIGRRRGAIEPPTRNECMRQVSPLGYVMLSAQDPGAWRVFGEECLGLQVGTPPAVSPERETVYFRSDDRSWRLGVEQGADGGLVALGFEVANQGALDQLAA